MKKTSLVAVGAMLVAMVLATGTGALEIGENHVENGDFEAGEIGAMPEEWWLKIVG